MNAPEKQIDILIGAQDIHTYYGASHVLRGIDFHVAQHVAGAVVGVDVLGADQDVDLFFGGVHQCSSPR